MKKSLNRVKACMFIALFPFLVVAFALGKSAAEFYNTLKNYRYDHDLKVAWRTIKTGDFNKSIYQQNEEYRNRRYKNS